MKPALEPVCLARKPLSEPTVAANVLRWGTGAINVDACRVGTEGATKRSHQEAYGAGGRADQGGTQAWRTGHDIEKLNMGRWPANVLHDGSDEVIAAFPVTKSEGRFPNAQNKHEASSFSVAKGRIAPERNMGDSGSAARFFYSAKASKHDRVGSKHPTVKPVDLMRYLCRLITPPGGMVLDPFAGTGTTGQAALEEGFDAVLVEREDEYCVDIATRMGLVDLTKKKETKSMRTATIYEAFDGKQFPNKEECARYEADHAESRLVGLTAEQVRAALSYEDVDLAGIIEKFGVVCAQNRRAAGDLKRRRNGASEAASATTEAQ